MILPVQISFRNMDHSEAVEARIRKAAAKLDTYYDAIMSCHVVVEAPHRHHRRGHPYYIKINIGVPDGAVLVTHEPSLHHAVPPAAVEKITKSIEVNVPHKDVYVAVRDAFDAARRRLEDYACRQRGAVKAHAPTPHARVRALFPKKGYGFINTPDGREIYFHRNSVRHDGFDHLKVGTEVSFTEEPGEKGPQASIVKRVAKHRRTVP